MTMIAHARWTPAEEGQHCGLSAQDKRVDGIARPLSRTPSEVKSRAHVLQLVLRKVIEMSAKTFSLICLIALSFPAISLAQGAPTVGGKPVVQIKPNVAQGCKLVGTVKGTKIWAGDCTSAAEIRGTTPAATAQPTLPEQAAGAIPAGQKQ